ncbi:ATP-binding protein [Aneurinibacillus aneurinilyticus]|uniref:ATP-binding protein n=2 Tax=Aneurinibacillus aneurinilyticus TaxID=1391 RepID=UPI0035244A34
MGVKAKKPISDDFRVRYFERNLIFTTKETLAVYKIPLNPIMFKSKEDKHSILTKLEDLFWVYRGKGQLLLLSRQESPEQHLEQLETLQYQNRFPEAYNEWKKAQGEQLEDQAPWRNELYLILHLPKKKQVEYNFELLTQQGPKAWWEKGPKAWAQKTLGAINEGGLQAIGKKMDLELEKIQEAIALEKSLYSQLNGTCPMERTTPRDTEWIIKRNFLRGLGEPETYIAEKSPVSLIEKEGVDTYLRPNQAAMLQLFGDSWIEEKMQSVVVHHGEKKEGKASYQAFLSLVDIPDENAPVGSEWLYWLMIFDFPVDISVRFNIIDPSKEMTRMRRKRKEFRGEAKTLAESGKEIPISMQETYEASAELEYKLGKGQPLMWAETILCVSGTTKAEMEDKARAIETFYRPRFFIFQRSVGDALRCFQAFIPGGDMESYWSFPVDPGFFASSGIHCNSGIGDPAGPYLGYTSQGAPARYNMARPMSRELNKAGTIVILGTLGGGKSVLKKKLMMEVLLLGGKCFDVDPKGEDHVFLEFPWLRKHTKVLRFRSGSEESTRLNVFRLSHNTEKAWEIAQGYLELLLEATAEARRLVISKAMERTMDHRFPSMVVFQEEMQKLADTEEIPTLRDQALLCSMLLEAYKKDPLGKIVFHNDQTELALSEYPLVVADLRGLVLPKDSKQMGRVLTAVERFSIGIMYLVTAMGQELMINAPKDILKLFSLDESWAITKIPQGEQLVKEFVKLGRSLNIVPLLATQEASDVENQDIRNNVGVVFTFRMNSPEEIEDAMDLLRMSSDVDEMVPKFRELKSGWCYFRDIEGRTNKIKVWLPDEWLKVFDTANDTAEEQRKK